VGRIVVYKRAFFVGISTGLTLAAGYVLFEYIKDKQTKLVRILGFSDSDYTEQTYIDFVDKLMNNLAEEMKRGNNDELMKFAVIAFDFGIPTPTQLLEKNSDNPMEMRMDFRKMTEEGF
jgi:hypothetical protein